MNNIWCKLMHYNIGVNSYDSDYLLNSTDKWNDVYQNKYYYSLISNHGTINQYLFTITNKQSYGGMQRVSHKSRLRHWIDIAENPFFSIENHTSLWNNFIKTQKMYYILGKFVNMCKIKSITVKVNTDLNLNVISLQPSQSIYLFQDGSLYYFTISDLINITNSALTYSYHFFSEAYCPKNPYTNNEFSYSILLKIYYSIRFSYYKMPMLLEMFYRSNFNIKHFKKVNEFFIREECIKSFMKNADIDDQYEYIEEMFSLKYCKKKFVFDYEFPKSAIVRAMKPYLFMYIISEYSLRCSQKIMEYRIMLRHSLLKFKDDNPQFGRKVVKLKREFSFAKKRNVTISKDVEYITDYKECRIVLPTYRELISEIVFKDDSDDDSDDESDDDDDTESVEIFTDSIINIRDSHSATRINIVESNSSREMSIASDSDDNSFSNSDTESIS
jgi:hypothetical protein